MEKTIQISFNGDKPIPDFIKDRYEVLVSKTAAGVEHYHLIDHGDAAKVAGTNFPSTT